MCSSEVPRLLSSVSAFGCPADSRLKAYWFGTFESFDVMQIKNVRRHVQCSAVQCLAFPHSLLGLGSPFEQAAHLVS